MNRIENERDIETKEKVSKDRKILQLTQESNGSVDGFSINDSSINCRGKDFVLCDSHDILRENSEIGTFANLKGSKRHLRERCVSRVNSHAWK